MPPPRTSKSFTFSILTIPPSRRGGSAAIPKTLLEGLSEERLQRFFSISHGSYCVTKEIRDLCTFSIHNLVRDPPFSMMSLVSCRNLLIYMNPELQARIIPVFHYCWSPAASLLLGGSESVAQHAELFETVDKTARIFQRREGRSPELNLQWHQPQVTSQMGGWTDDRAQDAHSSSSLTDRSIASLSRRTNGAGDNSHAAHFEHLLGAVVPSAETVAQLQTAFASAREELQSLAEEHQTALEELRSANEELHSVNEEMQSTNEELETSKEELQSLNEELHTVNLRLSEKIEELDQANSDLRNLFDSTEIATVFLDRHLVIRSFTTAIATIYNLIPSDHGRPLTDIVSHVQYKGLRADVAFVLSRLEPLSGTAGRARRSLDCTTS